MAATAPPRTQTRWTYHDLDDLPADLVRYELWEGELIISPAPTITHQEVAKRLLKLFTLHDPKEHLGVYYAAPADVVLDENLSLQPDVFWIANANRSIITPERIMGAPDLCVEVLSPSTAYADKSRKLHYYTQAGVRECWLVDPEAGTLTVYVLGTKTHVVYEAGAVARSSLPELAGLEVDVAKLFAALP